jgi:hypothetical protein
MLALLSHTEFLRISPSCVNINVFDVTLSTIKGPKLFSEGQSCHVDLKINNWIKPKDFSLQKNKKH